MAESRTTNRPQRVPPHSIEAEESALGSALLYPPAAAGVPAARDFYKPVHQYVAHAISQGVAAGHPIDVVTVADILRRDGLLEETGGLEFLLELTSSTPAYSNWARYAAIVSDTANLRRLIGVSAEIADLVYEGSGDVDTALTKTAEIMGRITATVDPTSSSFEIADLAALFATDLRPEEPLLLERSDGARLLYSGKVNMFMAETTSGKTMIALKIVAQVLAEGGSVVYIDHEDTPVGISLRLVQLGVAAAVVQDQTRFAYVRPSGGFGARERAVMTKLLADVNPDLVVIDALVGSMNKDGLDENVANDVETWANAQPRWIASTGAAVLILDHVTKDPEARGRYGRGSGRKLEMVDGVALQIKVRKSFSRTRAGSVGLHVAKDRPGGVGAIGEIVAIIHVEPAGGGEVITIRIEPYTENMAPGDTFKPTNYMALVAAELAKSDLTSTALRALLAPDKGKTKFVTAAIARLEQEGFITPTKSGRGRTAGWHLVKPYHGGTHRPEPPAEPDASLFDPGDVEEPDYLTAERRESAAAFQHLN